MTSLRLSRRALLGTAAVPLLAPGLARGQAGAGVGGGNQQPEITVDRARSAPIPIAIPQFGGTDLGAQIAQVVTNDLGSSGLFRPLGGQGAGDGGATPNFDTWKAIGAQALVTGNVAGSGGNVRVEFRLWDVLPGQQIQGTAYTTTEANWRRIAHIISDVIYERLLGEKGYFDTRIAYVSITGPRARQTRRLAIMDQDGYNTRFLTDGRWAALTPRFHPTRDELVFMSYRDEQPRCYTLNLDSGAQRLLGNFHGMTFAPRFSPDGSSVIMSVARGAGSDIVVVGASGGGERQLTNSGSIDTSPCYSPDGTQIVFNSDRGGDQQIYLMDAGGGGVRRISFGQGRYATPVWSPRGDLIAYTRLSAGTFAIGVMHPDGSGERILSESFSVEGPTWAPNGRVLMFYRETAARGPTGAGYSAHLVSIDATGFNERQIVTSTDASDPAWSPLLS
ncbi:MAG: Tol-Pal system beta propeller repeat protein TolB [Pseudomonadota bacterium]|nr:Tol-Pal system beta propeller repeat protein TolB [Pseudomonadota bacterium]